MSSHTEFQPREILTAAASNLLTVPVGDPPKHGPQCDNTGNIGLRTALVVLMANTTENAELNMNGCL